MKTENKYYADGEHLYRFDGKCFLHLNTQSLTVNYLPNAKNNFGKEISEDEFNMSLAKILNELEITRPEKFEKPIKQSPRLFYTALIIGFIIGLSNGIVLGFPLAAK